MQPRAVMFLGPIQDYHDEADRPTGKNSVVGSTFIPGTVTLL